MKKQELISTLKELYKNLATTDLKMYSELERTKIIDLYADIQNAIIFLETGKNTDFNPDWRA